MSSSLRLGQGQLPGNLSSARREKGLAVIDIPHQSLNVAKSTVVSPLKSQVPFLLRDILHKSHAPQVCSDSTLSVLTSLPLYIFLTIVLRQLHSWIPVTSFFFLHEHHSLMTDKMPYCASATPIPRIWTKARCHDSSYYTSFQKEEQIFHPSDTHT